MDKDSNKNKSFQMVQKPKPKTIIEQGYVPPSVHTKPIKKAK